jgi:hypothetical protein
MDVHDQHLTDMYVDINIYIHTFALSVYQYIQENLGIE